MELTTPAVHAPLRGVQRLDPADAKKFAPGTLGAPFVDAERVRDPARLAASGPRAFAAADEKAAEHDPKRGGDDRARRASGEKPHHPPWHRHQTPDADECGVGIGWSRVRDLHRVGAPRHQVRSLQPSKTALDATESGDGHKPGQLFVCVVRSLTILSALSPRHQLMARQPHSQVEQRDDLRVVKLPGSQNATGLDQDVAALWYPVRRCRHEVSSSRARRRTCERVRLRVDDIDG